MSLFNPFLQMALWASLLASCASGIIGSFVVIKRITFIAGSISHSILGGIGICLWLQKVQGISWATPLFGAFAAALLSALLIGWIHLHYKQREDAVIASLWSTGMAIGVIFLSITPGNHGDILHFLFGNLLWTTPEDLYLLATLDVLILTLVIWQYPRFLTLCFDEEQALLQGVHVKQLYILLLSLVALTVVLLMQIIGTILVIALLALPATLAGLLVHRLPLMMGLATLFSAIFSTLGITVAYFLDWPPGGTIALLATFCYFGTLLLKRKNSRVSERFPQTSAFFDKVEG